MGNHQKRVLFQPESLPFPLIENKGQYSTDLNIFNERIVAIINLLSPALPKVAS